MCSKLCCKGERSHQTMGARYGAYYMDQQVIGHKGAVHTQSHTPTHKYMTTKIHLRASSTATRVRPISQVILFERTCRLSKDIMGDILQVLLLLPPPPTMGEQWLLKQFCLNHPVDHIQKPKLPKLYVRVETSTSYFIIHNQFVK